MSNGAKELDSPREGASYNNREEIEASLVSLESFCNLANERRDAGYRRSERLTEFVVMGRYALDSVGNFGFVEEIEEKLRDRLPKVCTYEEFMAFELVKHLCVSHRGRPSPTQYCSICRRRWTLENYHDSVDMNRDGAYAHVACARLRYTSSEREQFLLVLEMAGLKNFHMTPIPNGYWSTTPEKPYATPWYEVETPWGKVVVGWRKRVIEINWEATPFRFLFPDDVTKKETMIHAWSMLDAARYLDVFRRRMENPA